MNKGKRKAVFLDRDGTINKEIKYIAQIKDVHLIPGSAQAIASINATGTLVVIVSNQSGLARGYFNELDLFLVQSYLNKLLKVKGAWIDACYFCPHHPNGLIKDYAMKCNCRKPAPGLIKQAIKDLDLMQAGSFLIGDRCSDIACGKALGLVSVLVRTGKNIISQQYINKPDYIANNLLAAVNWILPQLR